MPLTLKIVNEELAKRGYDVRALPEGTGISIFVAAKLRTGWSTA